MNQGAIMNPEFWYEGRNLVVCYFGYDMRLGDMSKLFNKLHQLSPLWWERATVSQYIGNTCIVLQFDTAGECEAFCGSSCFHAQELTKMNQAYKELT